MAYTAESIEPQAFSAFVRSFRLLDPDKNAYQAPVWTLDILYVGVLATMMIVELAMLIRRRRPAAGIPEATGTPVGASAKPPTTPGLTTWSGVLLVVGVLVILVNGYLLSFGHDLAYMIGVGAGTAQWPFAIAYFFAGRRRLRDWNRFARLFFWLSVFNPALALKGAGG